MPPLDITLPPTPEQAHWSPELPASIPAPPEIEPSLTPQQIALFARQFYDQMSPLQRLWILCQDVVTGFRGYTSNDMLVRTGMEAAYFNRARDIAFNIIQPLFRNASSKLAMMLPTWGTLPATVDAEALAAASADEQVLTYILREQEIPYKLNEAVDWSIIYGTVALLETLSDEQDATMHAFAPWFIRAEPGIPDPDKSRFLGVTRVTTRDELKRKFPGHDEIIDQAPRPRHQTSWWGGYDQMAPDRVEVLEAYCRSGHWYLIVNETVLAQGFTPKRCMPIQIVRYTKLPFEFFGMGMVEQGIPGQYAYSQSWNLALSNMRYMSQPKILIEKNSGIAPDAFSARAGEKIYFQNTPPQQWKGQPLPEFAAMMPANAMSAAADATGIHPQSQGKRTPGVVTGAAVDAMISADETQFGHTKLQFKQALERAGKVLLLYVKAYYPEDKYIAQFDRFGSGIAVMLRGQDLTDSPNVFIESDTLFAADAQARQDRIIKLAQLGAIPPDKVVWMLQNNIDPMRPQRPITDYIDAKKALDAVVRNGMQAPDPRTGMMRPVVRFYASDNLQVFGDVAKQFIRSDAFNALPIERQDDVDAYYRIILNYLSPQPVGAPGAPAAPSAPASPPKLKQEPGLPEGATPGVTPGNAGGGAMETSNERTVMLQHGEAEIRDEFTR